MTHSYHKIPFDYQASLKAVDLECVRGHRPLFENLNLSINSGEITQVTGSNGVGKTSLLRILAGLSNPELGSVNWNDNDIYVDSWKYQCDLAYLGHKSGLRPGLTIYENLEFFAALEYRQPDLPIENSLKIWALESMGDTLVSQLSSGQRQRAALARLIRSHASLWIMDEPATSLDDEAQIILEQVMSTHVRAAGLIIYTSHQSLNLSEIDHSQVVLN